MGNRDDPLLIAMLPPVELELGMPLLPIEVGILDLMPLASSAVVRMAEVQEDGKCNLLPFATAKLVAVTAAVPIAVVGI